MIKRLIRKREIDSLYKKLQIDNNNKQVNNNLSNNLNMGTMRNKLSNGFNSHDINKKLI